MPGRAGSAGGKCEGGEGFKRAAEEARRRCEGEREEGGGVGTAAPSAGDGRGFSQGGGVVMGGASLQLSAYMYYVLHMYA